MEHAVTEETFQDLGELEQAVMQLIWTGRPKTAEVVREQLPRRLKESTVRTVLRRLEEKGYVTHTVDGRTYVFQAAEARGRVAAKAVRGIVDRFCNGSVEEVLVGMIDAKMFDRRQLDMLREKIEKAKKKR
jgi:predicted transcriptional regulator